MAPADGQPRIPAPPPGPAGTVSAHREDRKIVEHPSAGPVTVDCDVLTDGDTELKIVILTAVLGTEDETRLRLAAMAEVRG